MRRSVSTAVLLVALGLGIVGLAAGTGNFTASAQQKPETTEVKIDNFTFGPADADGAGGNHGHVDESRRHSPHGGQYATRCSNPKCWIPTRSFPSPSAKRAPIRTSARFTRR